MWRGEEYGPDIVYENLTASVTRESLAVFPPHFILLNRRVPICHRQGYGLWIILCIKKVLTVARNNVISVTN